MWVYAVNFTFTCLCARLRLRSDYIIGFIAPAIGLNKSKKPTRLIASAHNKRGKILMKIIIHGLTDDDSICL